MKTSKRYIPILISLALLSLIALQVKWLFFVYEYKKQELADNTRDAVLEATGRLKRNEDSRFILNNIDSLIKKNSLSPLVKEDLQFVVANIKNKLKIDSVDMDTKSDREIRIIRDTFSSTTIVQIDPGKKQKIIIRSEAHVKRNPKKKAKELEELFLKMAISAEDVQKNIDERVDTIVLKKLLRDALLERGIDLVPQYGITFFPRNNKPGSIPYHIVFNTPGYSKILPAMVNVELFPGDVVGGMLYIKLGYNQSTTNFVIKQMAGLLALSLFITILIAFVMIHIFRRMLSQEKLHQIKNDFINNITHELKTPIATISLANANIASAVNSGNVSNISQYTRIINEENKKLNSHIEKVFELSLLEKEKQIFDLGNSNVHELIAESLAQNNQVINETKAAISLSLNAGDHIVKLDKFHFVNMISNLLDNAIKYNSGNIEIEISTKNAGDKIIISIKDNGIGINKEQQKFIFDKFFRVTNKNLHTTKGFGIGLSYVKQTIGLFNGNISVNSEENKGSEFIIELPYVKG